MFLWGGYDYSVLESSALQKKGREAFTFWGVFGERFKSTHRLQPRAKLTGINKTIVRHFQKFKFQILNFKFQISIGQGWGGTARTDGTARQGPSPGQLKFEIWNLNLNFWNSSYFIVRKRLSDDHPTAVHLNIQRPSVDRPTRKTSAENKVCLKW